MIVGYTAAADADLEDIGNWIARDNPSRALTFVAELREACEGLATRSRQFPIIMRHRGREIRRRVYGNYLIFYVAEKRHVVVLHVLHGARDYDSILSGEALREASNHLFTLYKMASFSMT